MFWVRNERLKYPALLGHLNASSSKRKCVPSVWLDRTFGSVIAADIWLVPSDLKGFCRFQFPVEQKRLLLGTKIIFFRPHFQHLQPFHSSSFQPPHTRPDRASATFTCGLLASASASLLEAVRRPSVKKRGLWRHIPVSVCPFPSLVFPLFLPSGLIFPPLSLFIVQHPLCAWTLFFHELVDTSVNEGKQHFYRPPLCVGEAVWTARPRFLARMRRSLSALLVLWPFTSLLSPIPHFSAVIYH